MFCYPKQTAPATPVVKQLTGSYSKFFGLSSTYAESANFFIQLWWQGNNNNAPTFATTPTLTIEVGSAGFFSQSTEAIVMEGPIWFAVTAAAIPATTAITGGEV